MLVLRKKSNLSVQGGISSLAVCCDHSSAASGNTSVIGELPHLVFPSTASVDLLREPKRKCPIATRHNQPLTTPPRRTPRGRIIAKMASLLHQSLPHQGNHEDAAEEQQLHTKRQQDKQVPSRLHRGHIWLLVRKNNSRLPQKRPGQQPSTHLVFFFPRRSSR
ncbi:hypothetical protein B0J13DRAFT_553686 [Dactylonectria estremocensis]|uniref:Uncharacterized protein n=1 Tax=Dactylonectria estremocensis TaxID=1079267 RepID=A0A9P9J5Q9_9HYPO|nr:hypothetical protein B0J13DRAFT_553686 [Dactylonectria estremocensis]